jgi:hypothetical protein
MHSGSMSLRSLLQFNWRFEAFSSDRDALGGNLVALLA